MEQKAPRPQILQSPHQGKEERLAHKKNELSAMVALTRD